MLCKPKASFLYPRRESHTMEISNADLKLLIRNYKDFPKKGVIFKDINPLFRNSDAIQKIAKEFIKNHEEKEIDFIAGIESRGFTVASLLAVNFHKGLILIRKSGKLPGDIVKKKYDIEYGNAVMEIQTDASKEGQKILVADDLIATGGTALASAELIEQIGGKIFAFAFIIELTYLGGADSLRDKGYEVRSLIKFDR